MNARSSGRSPNDRQLEQFFESVGELGKDELLDEFEQAFCDIVPPARAVAASQQANRNRSMGAIHNEFAPPNRGRQRAPRKSRLPNPPLPPTRFKGSA